MMKCNSLSRTSRCPMCVFWMAFVSITSMYSCAQQPRPALRAAGGPTPEVLEVVPTLKRGSGGAADSLVAWRPITQGKTCIGEFWSGGKTARIARSSSITSLSIGRGFIRSRSQGISYTAGVGNRSQRRWLIASGEWDVQKMANVEEFTAQAVSQACSTKMGLPTRIQMKR